MRNRDGPPLNDNGLLYRDENDIEEDEEDDEVDGEEDKERKEEEL